MPMSIVLNNSNFKHLEILHNRLDPEIDLQEFCTVFVNRYCSQNFEEMANSIQKRMLKCETCNLRFSIGFDSEFKYCPKCNKELEIVFENEVKN